MASIYHIKSAINPFWGHLLGDKGEKGDVGLTGIKGDPGTKGKQIKLQSPPSSRGLRVRW